MAFVFVWNHVECQVVPRAGDLRETILDGKFFRRSTRDVLDLVKVLVKAPVNDPLQSKVLRLVVKLTTSFCLSHQRHHRYDKQFFNWPVTCIDHCVQQLLPSLKPDCYQLCARDHPYHLRSINSSIFKGVYKYMFIFVYKQMFLSAP